MSKTENNDPQIDVVTQSQQRIEKKRKRRNKIFSPLLWLTVIIPTITAISYFGCVASDQYISESSFVVRSPSNPSSGVSGLGVLFQGLGGMSRAQDDTYTVQEYMRSRTALDALTADNMPVRNYYENKGDIFSRFNGFGWHDSNEAFYQYYRKKISINFDSVSGIATLRVLSFDPKESHQINQALLQKGEMLINQLNQRARSDTISFAQENVKQAEEHVKNTADKLMVYRIENGIFDLKEQSSAQLNLVSKLQDELIVIQTQLDQVRAITPDNPQIAGLQTREKSLRDEIKKQSDLIAGRNRASMASRAAEYQRLMLENELAEKQMAAAMTSLESARAEADRQQLYLEVVAKPNVPDMSQEPKRLYNTLATFVIGLMLYGVLSLLLASVREHKN